jgi:hypothetical protein
MDTRTYPKNLNVRIESTEDMKRKLETIRRHWRLRSQSEAARSAIDMAYDIARSAEDSPLAAGGHVPAPTSESHGDAG